MTCTPVSLVPAPAPTPISCGHILGSGGHSACLPTQTGSWWSAGGITPGKPALPHPHQFFTIYQQRLVLRKKRNWLVQHGKGRGGRGGEGRPSEIRENTISGLTPPPPPPMSPAQCQPGAGAAGILKRACFKSLLPSGKPLCYPSPAPPKHSADTNLRGPPVG